MASAKFAVGVDKTWRNTIQEVTLGATKANGGSRGHVVKLGGEKAMPFFPDAAMPHAPKITMDVFDMPIGMAKAVKMHYEDVINSPRRVGQEGSQEVRRRHGHRSPDQH